MKNVFKNNSRTFNKRHSEKRNIAMCRVMSFFVFLAFILHINMLSGQNMKPNSDFAVFDKKKSNDFILSEKGIVTPLVVSAFDYIGVIDAMKCLQSDMKAVTGVEPKLLLDRIPQNQQIVIVGTLGNSPLIDQLIKTKKINVDEIKGKWENSLIEVIENPFANVARALVIVGSDQRGTIFGIYDLSEKIGVSPWYWWADVPIPQQINMYIKPGRYNLGEPKIKYRGIFISDEEPSLSRWAVENYGGFNRQFYEKVFELVLRLKGNFMWPAMWLDSFNSDDPINANLANEMGIVMGTSYQEPMSRAWAEWKKNGKGAWNYEKNREELKQFWADGIKRIGKSEVIVNLGMRGDGDVAMSNEINVALLEKIVTDQRKIISDVTGKPITETLQMWALYKEVQDYYDKGMRVPDDVTLILCDDNWGNIRKLPKPGTPDRKGGYGIYYHFDYVGEPRNYKWVNTNPIPRIWEQMDLAYEHGANQLWIVNVGDLKPMEYPISFFLNYAWNPEKWPSEKLPDYSKKWCAQQFGEKQSEEIASLIDTYVKYNSRRKPELLAPEIYSLINYREAETVVDDYNNLLDRAIKVSKKLPKEYNDAFYQLVQHPIEACANLNELYFTVAKNRLYAAQWRINANDLAKKAEQLFKKDGDISEYYNKKLSGGKWNNMMNQTHIGYTSWQQPDKNIMPEEKIIQPKSDASMGVAVEGSEIYRPLFQGDLLLPVFDSYNIQSYYFELFNQGKKSYNFQIITGHPWVKVSESKGKIESEKRIIVQIDWGKAPEGKNSSTINITGSEGSVATIHVVIENYSEEQKKGVKGFIESNGYISIEAEHYSKNLPNSSASWKLIPGLGRTLSAMHPVPVNAIRQNPKAGAPALEYNFHLYTTGEIKVNTYLSPTLNIYNDEGLKYAISIDDEEPQIMNMHSNFSTQNWEESVKNNSRVITSTHNIKDKGNHVLKIWMVDPGVVVEKFIIQTGEPKNSYLGAPESFNFVEKK